MWASSLCTGMVFAAADATTGIVSRQWDWPETPAGWALLLLLGPVAMAWAVFWYRRDSRELSPIWRVIFTSLRIIVLAGLVVIALNPEERIDQLAIKPSRVALLVDTSLSMRHPAADPLPTDSISTGTGLATAAERNGPVGIHPSQITRATAAEQLLHEQGLVRALRRDHEVSLFTFDSALIGPTQVWLPLAANQADGTLGAPATAATDTAQSPSPAATAAGTSNPTTSNPPSANTLPDQPSPAGQGTGTGAGTSAGWSEALQPRGLETRLGEALGEALREVGGRTLSGIVLISDGSANAGLAVESLLDRAAKSGTRVFTVGIGGTSEPINLQVLDLQAPTEVQVGDPYEITAFIAGQGLAGQLANVELLSETEDRQGPATLIAEQQVTLAVDGGPTEVQFVQKATATGTARFLVRVSGPRGLVEASQDDNESAFAVRALERPLRVLLVAGGPTREYQFVRNLLYRHKSVEVDVYLQTAAIGTSQESRELLFEFPADRESLFGYDVLIAFDPDWKAIPADRLQNLADWVSNEAGGLIAVAGDVYTQQLAATLDAGLSGNAKSSADPLVIVRELYPVVLNSYLAELRFDQESSQPWPLGFTAESATAGFLQLTDDAVSSLTRWKEFAGFYRCYPTISAKAGAVVYARFTDPRAQDSIVLASQFYGQGRTLYLGSGELWRLRAVNEDDYDRFWIKAIREFGQGRLKRGTRRGRLLVDSQRATLGQNLRLRARLLDSQFQPLAMDSVPLEVIDPNGRIVGSARRLLRDPDRPGEYQADLRLASAGLYRIELPIPESREKLAEEVRVVPPRLEDEDLRQNVKLLNEIARQTGGRYFTLAEAAKELPELLTSRQESILVPESLQTIWDRDWVLYGLIGCLCVEWLCRKLLQLA